MSAGYVIYSLNSDKFRQLVERPNQKQLKSLGKLLRDGLAAEEGQFEDGDPILKWPTDVKSLGRIAGQRLTLADWYGDLSTAGKALWEGVIFNACMNCNDIDVGFRVDNDGIYWDVIEIVWRHHGIVPQTITPLAVSTFGTRPYRYLQARKVTMSREEYDRGEGDRIAALSALREAIDEFHPKPKKAPKGPKTKDKNKAAQEGIEDIFKMLQDPAVLSQKLQEGLTDFMSTPAFAKLEKIAEKLPKQDDDFEEWSPMHSMHTPDEVQQMRTELKAAAPAMKATKDNEARREYEQELMPAIEKVVKDGRMLFIQVDT